jgi:hypothetical protein
VLLQLLSSLEVVLMLLACYGLHLDLTNHPHDLRKATTLMELLDLVSRLLDIGCLQLDSVKAQLDLVATAYEVIG